MREDEDGCDISYLPVEQLQGILPESAGHRLNSRNQGKLKGNDCEAHISARDSKLQPECPLCSRWARDRAHNQGQEYDE